MIHEVKVSHLVYVKHSAIPVIKHKCYWKKLRIQYLGFSGQHWQKSGLCHDFFSTHVQLQDFSGPEK